jgi:hypothetical protein
LRQETRQNSPVMLAIKKPPYWLRLNRFTILTGEKTLRTGAQRHERSDSRQQREVKMSARRYLGERRPLAGTLADCIWERRWEKTTPTR